MNVHNSFILLPLEYLQEDSCRSVTMSCCLLEDPVGLHHVGDLLLLEDPASLHHEGDLLLQLPPLLADVGGLLG